MSETPEQMTYHGPFSAWRTARDSQAYRIEGFTDGVTSLRSTIPAGEVARMLNTLTAKVAEQQHLIDDYQRDRADKLYGPDRVAQLIQTHAPSLRRIDFHRRMRQMVPSPVRRTHSQARRTHPPQGPHPRPLAERKAGDDVRCTMPSMFHDGEWRRWFAWRPVRLQATGEWVWMEYVERTPVPTMYLWTYRSVTK